MTLPRDRNRHGITHQVPGSPVPESLGYAAVPSEAFVSDVQAAQSGRENALVSPVVTYEVMPANGQRGIERIGWMEPQMPVGMARLGEYRAPEGWVAVIRSLQLITSIRPDGRIPMNSRIMELRKNGVKVLGQGGGASLPANYWMWELGNPAWPVHIVIGSSDVLELWGRIDGAGVGEMSLKMEVDYLARNNNPDDYVELVAGRVEV